MSAQPEALRLAGILEKMPLGQCDEQAAAELRRLHELNIELLAVLSEYNLPLTGNEGRDNHDFGVFQVARELRRRAAIAKAEAS